MGPEPSAWAGNCRAPNHRRERDARRRTVPRLAWTASARSELPSRCRNRRDRTPHGLGICSGRFWKLIARSRTDDKRRYGQALWVARRVECVSAMQTEVLGDCVEIDRYRKGVTRMNGHA